MAVDEALRNGDADLQNAVLVSFVEDAGAFPEETPEFLATWPARAPEGTRGAPSSVVMRASAVSQ